MELKSGQISTRQRQRGFAVAEILGVCLILKVVFLEPKKVADGKKSGN